MFTRNFVDEGTGAFFLGTGTVTAFEITEATRWLSANLDAFRRLRFAILDFQNATQLALTCDDLRRVVELDMQLAAINPNVVVAIIAPQEHLFGIARMWEVFAEPTGWNISVFRTAGEAREWIAQQQLPQ